MTEIVADIMLGVPVDKRTLDELVQDSLASVENRESKQVFACANAYSLIVAQKDAVYMQALCDADQVVADGVGITKMGRLANMHVGPHITGSDYFRAIMKALDDRGNGRVFFFGSSENVLDKMAAQVSKEFENLDVCGTLSPPFREWSEEENDAMIEEINRFSPDVLWVGMTAPKQEKWVADNKDRLNAAVIGSIGAVFDFFSGSKPEPPEWIRRGGLEWLFRMVSEPRRVGGRRLIPLVKFVCLVTWRHILFSQKDKAI